MDGDFVPEPITHAWHPYEKSRRNLVKFAKEGMAYHATFDHSGKLASFSLAMNREVTLGIERQVTIYAVSAVHLIAQLLHVVETADRSLSFIPVSFPDHLVSMS